MDTQLRALLFLILALAAAIGGYARFGGTFGSPPIWIDVLFLLCAGGAVAALTAIIIEQMQDSTKSWDADTRPLCRVRQQSRYGNQRD